MPLFYVRSALAEASAWGRSKTWLRVTGGYPTTRPTGRIHTGATALGSADREQVRLQSCFVRMVGGAEAFTDAVLLGMLDREAEALTPVLGQIFEDYTASVTATWDAREKALRRDFGIVLNHWASYPLLLAATDVRNTIAHGLGRMTRRQLRRPGPLARIQTLGVYVDQGVLDLDVTNIRTCREICIGFTSWLDEAAYTALGG